MAFNPIRPFVFFDTETTGLHPRADRLIEIAAIKYQGGKEIGRFQSLINPGIPIPTEASSVHKITNEMVASARPASEVLPEFMSFMKGSVGAAYNANFDIGMISAELQRAGLSIPEDMQIVDVFSLAKMKHPIPKVMQYSKNKSILTKEPAVLKGQLSLFPEFEKDLPNRKLGTLYAHYREMKEKVGDTGSIPRRVGDAVLHRADVDVQATKEIYEALNPSFKEYRLARTGFSPRYLERARYISGKSGWQLSLPFPDTRDMITGMDDLGWHEFLSKGSTKTINKIAPVVSRKSGVAIPYLKAMGVLAGAYLGIKTISNLFGNNNEAVNSFEGLGHKGIAPLMRQDMTDFGSRSRFIGAISKAFSNIGKTLESKATTFLSRIMSSNSVSMTKHMPNITELAQVAKGMSPSELAIHLEKNYGTMIDIVKDEYLTPKLKEMLERSGGAFVAKPGPSGIWSAVQQKNIHSRFIVAHEKTIAKTFAEAAKVNPSETVKTVIMHEFGETRSLTAQEDSVRNLITKIKDKQYLKLTGHAHKSVLEFESAYASYQGKEFHEAMKGHRREWDVQFYKSKFSGHDDAYNTIEGLRHGGFAQKLRKIFTMFGSGYDRVRALAQMAGKTFEEFTESSVFKTALSRATFVKELGRGSFGKVQQFKTTIMGEELILAKKTLEPTQEWLQELSLRPEKAYLFDIANERKALQTLGHTPSVPSFYGQSGEKSFFMEFMPVKDIEPGQQLTEQFFKDINETIKEASVKNILNTDIHAGNLKISESGRGVWLDWGYATETKAKASITELTMKEQLDTFISSNISNQASTRNITIPSSTKTELSTTAHHIALESTQRAKISLNRSSVYLYDTKKQLSDLSINGGHRHLTKRPSEVYHHSMPVTQLLRKRGIR